MSEGMFEDDLSLYVHEFFAEGLHEIDVDELLVMVGHNLVRRSEREFPQPSLIEGTHWRSDGKESHYAQGRRVGRKFLRDWLRVFDALSPESSGSSENSYPIVTKERLIRCVHDIGDSVTSLGGHMAEAVLLAAILMKTEGGVSSVSQIRRSLSHTYDYDLFDLKIFEGAIFATCADGEISSTYDIHTHTASLETTLEELRMGALTPRRCRDMGDLLWSILFPPVIWSLLERCMGTAKGEGFAGIRIRLSVDDQGLAHIPWELARYPVTGEFLATSEQVVLTRYLHRQGRKAVGKPLRKTRRLVVLLGSPNDANTGLYGEEFRHLLECGQHYGMEVIRLHSLSIRDIRRTLAGENFDILHFIGHGEFTDGIGYLRLESTDGIVEKYSADRLAVTLKADNLPILVFLNSCSGASSSDYRSFIGLAPRLIQRGIEAVVAMSGLVEEATATLFSKEFYGLLGDGYPLILAMQRGRQAVFHDIGDTRIDFVTPVLFMSR